jgi:hypothetical protein
MIPQRVDKPADETNRAPELQRGVCRWLWLEYRTGVATKVSEPRCRWRCVYPGSSWPEVSARVCSRCPRWEPRQAP